MTGRQNIGRGVWFLLSGNPDWRRHFNLRLEGLKPSFIAIVLTWPLYMICAAGAQRQSEQEALVSLSAVVFIVMLMTLTFPVIAYLICQLMSRMDIFRDWVIARNWTMLFVVAGMALGFGLYLLGIASYRFAYALGLTAYLGTLLADIRVAQVAAEMEWMPAIFSACAIALCSLLVLLGGFASVAG